MTQRKLTKTFTSLLTTWVQQQLVTQLGS